MTKGYATLDAGVQLEESPPVLEVWKGLEVSGPSGSYLHFEDKMATAPTIKGVVVTKAITFIDGRRVLVVAYNPITDSGALGYTLVLNPGCSVGDHYHKDRAESIILIRGRICFRLEDKRNTGNEVVNQFFVEEEGVTIFIPVGVAHSIHAEGSYAVIQVKATCDYRSGDDVHVHLSDLPVE